MILLYKGWLETRVRFLYGLSAMAMLVMVTIFSYSAFSDTASHSSARLVFVPFAKRALEAVETGYLSFIWGRFNALNQLLLMPVLAMTIAGCGIFPNGACVRGRGRIEGGAVAFNLSLPVRRRTLLLWRTLVGAMELAGFALVPYLLLVALSPLVGTSYPLPQAIIYGWISYVALLVPYALGLIVTALIDDDMTGRLASIGFLLMMLVIERSLDLEGPLAYYRMLSGESYFTHHAIPWGGMTLCLLAAAAFTWTAIQIVERRDY